MRKPALRGRRAVRIAALLVLAGGPLTGCGVRETAVIEAGRPAVADLFPPREGRVLLFFFSPDNELLPVPRTVEVPWRSGNAGSAGPDDSSAGPDDSSAGPDEPHGQDGSGGSIPSGEGTSESLTPLVAVTALLAGPDKAERRAGLRNDPSLPGAASVAERIVTGGSAVEVELRLRVKRLTAPARDQIVCTAAYAAHAQGAVSVSLVGQDGRLAPADCPVRPVKLSAR